MLQGARPPAGAKARHATSMAYTDGPRASPRVGELFEVVVPVGCKQGCDLGAVDVSVTGPDGTVQAQRAAMGRITLAAPTEAGTHQWLVRYEGSEAGDASHSSCALTLTFDVMAHEASLAVWATPDAAIAGTPFKVTVGASSTSGQLLSGQPVEVRDGDGNTVARVALGGEPWPGTNALAWAEAKLMAPVVAGISTWSAKLVTAGLMLPHQAYALVFTVPVIAVPEHSLAVSVLEAATGAPIGEATIRIGALRATTDATGCAQLRLPKGAFEIVVWKAGFEAPNTMIDVVEDAEITIEVVAVPEEDPDARWRG